MARRSPRVAKETRLLGLIDQLYASATTPEEWPAFLKQLVELTGSEAVVFLVHDPTSQQGVAYWQYGFTEAAAQEYPAWASRNLYLNATLPFLRTGTFVPNVPLRRSQILASDYYNEFLRRHANVVDSMGVCPFREPSLLSALTPARSATKSDYGPAEHEVMRVLMPHLQRAISIYRRLGSAELEKTSRQEVLDEIPVGILFLDAGRRVVFFNREADRLLRRQDGVRLDTEGRLTAAWRPDDRRLQRYVGAACRVPRDIGETPGGALPIHRASGQRPYAVIVGPLGIRHQMLLLAPPVAVVFVTDSERLVGRGEHLRQLYGLTPAETRVGLLLARGYRVADVVDELHISTATARTHVKRLLSKTNTRAQADLVRVLIAGTFGMRST